MQSYTVSQQLEMVEQYKDKLVTDRETRFPQTLHFFTEYQAQFALLERLEYLDAQGVDLTEHLDPELFEEACLLCAEYTDLEIEFDECTTEIAEGHDDDSEQVNEDEISQHYDEVFLRETLAKKKGRAKHLMWTSYTKNMKLGTFRGQTVHASNGWFVPKFY